MYITYSKAHIIFSCLEMPLDKLETLGMELVVMVFIGCWYVESVVIMDPINDLIVAQLLIILSFFGYKLLHIAWYPLFKLVTSLEYGLSSIFISQQQLQEFMF